ncbi:MAG: taurine ABC transporter permease [Candidatus Rokuibacteriota bacterium]|nr:MAG: taurine ABC transporter permease [Candidatus Rokubacteria bacterium]
MTTRHREILMSIFSPLVVLIAWEVVVRANLVDARFFPAPTSIVGTFWALIRSGDLASAVGVSLTRIGAGFLMGAVPALVLGLGLGLSRMVRAFANPIIYALYPVPKVAILPLVMLIFGLGEMSKYVIIAIAVFFLVLVNTIAGVVQIDPIYFDVARNFNASRRDFYLGVVLRGALPAIFTGLKLAMGVALIVLVTAEFVGARSGIGVMIYESWQVFAIERLFVGLVVVSFLGYVLSLLLDELERLVIPWQRDRR